MRQKQDKPVDEMQGIPVAPSNNTTDGIRRRNKVGVIISAAVLGIIAIALVTMYVISL